MTNSAKVTEGAVAERGLASGGQPQSLCQLQWEVLGRGPDEMRPGKHGFQPLVQADLESAVGPSPASQPALQWPGWKGRWALRYAGQSRPPEHAGAAC